MIRIEIKMDTKYFTDKIYIILKAKLLWIHKIFLNHFINFQTAIFYNAVHLSKSVLTLQITPVIYRLFAKKKFLVLFPPMAIVDERPSTTPFTLSSERTANMKLSRDFPIVLYHTQTLIFRSSAILSECRKTICTIAWFCYHVHSGFIPQKNLRHLFPSISNRWIVVQTHLGIYSLIDSSINQTTRPA